MTSPSSNNLHHSGLGLTE